MKHKVSKLKIKSGKDANKMLIRKLVRNFVVNGKIKTTLTKAKYLKSKIESLAHMTLSYSESVKNVLLPYFQTEQSVLLFVDEVKKRVTNGTGSGCVKMQKLGERRGDASPMAQVVWTNSEVVQEKKESKKKPNKSKVKKDVKTAEAENTVEETKV
jgi:large subunit ribosomal protein L17